MQYRSYYRNHFVPLAASLSDDAFLAFGRQVLDNLKVDPARAAEAALLQPLYDAQRAARQAVGTGGKSGKVASLSQTIREFYAWVRLTNATTVFARFPLAKAPERLDILPNGTTGIYDADHDELLAEATTYVQGLHKHQPTLGATAATEGDAWLTRLTDALGGRSTQVKDLRLAATTLDEAERATCTVLFRIHARLLDIHAEEPLKAYAFFPYPDSEHPAPGNAAPAPPA